MARRQEFTGCSRSPTMCSTPIYRPESVGSGDNSKCGAGGYLHWQVCLGLDKKGSLPTITGIFGTELHAEISRSAAATGMCGRKTPGSPTPSSSSESVLSSGTIPRWDLIWEMAVAGDLGAIRLKFEFKVIGLCEQSVLTLQSRLEWSELAKFTGVELGLGSHGELGKRQAWTLMLKIQTRSFGVGTVARELLSSMNFEEESMCLTSSDGLTVIQSTWKSKAVPVLWQPQRSG